MEEIVTALDKRDEGSSIVRLEFHGYVCICTLVKMELVNVLVSAVFDVCYWATGGTILFKSRLLVPVLAPQVPLIVETVIP